MMFILSIGRWGGVYWFNGYTKRLCLGWVAFTFVPQDDSFFRDALEDVGL